MIFSVEQVRGIRGAKITATLVPVSERIRVGSTRLLRRRVPVSDDGEQPSRVEVVVDRKPDGEETAVVLTVLDLRDVEIAALSFVEARPCGARTPAVLRDQWHELYPRAELARLVTFALGDLRDVPRLVAAGWPDFTADPSRAMRGEPEAISAADTAWYGSYARQQHEARRATLAGKLAAAPASDRLAAIVRRRGRA